MNPARTSTERWRQIETLFHRASELEKEARTEFLEGACKGDAELRSEVESLLSSSDQTLADLRSAVQSEASSLIGTGIRTDRIGPYRLIRLLAEGGMGAVYLGERADNQYRRTVAIKLLHLGLMHSQALQLRFRTERQILANLDHPNIARLLDGGIAGDGSPYLVMEYVDGVAIDEYCRDQGLTVTARLALFRNLCSAVDYAHRHLVIHRDIKPGNVLVTKEGVPKLLDFGIAKLLDSDQMGNDAAVTRVSERLLTPDYASPEQIQGKPVSTATDVYALGLLLFELLTGELPFHAAGVRPLARAKAICEDRPPQASGVAARSGALPQGEAAKLKGDLDNIIARCLEIDPAQRYSSAAQLLEDVDSYLALLPVRASDGDRLYRLRRFARRHRIGVLFAMCAVVLVVGFALAMALLARRSTRNELRARREQEFLSSIFTAATPEGSNGKEVTARQLLESAAKRTDTELRSDPQLDASMKLQIGQAFTALALYDAAQPLLEKAADLARNSDGEKSAEYGDNLLALGTVYRLQGSYQRAEPLFRRAVEIREARQGQNSPGVAEALGALGEDLYLQDKNAEAETLLRRALAIERAHGDPPSGTRSYLALVLERRGDYPEAAAVLQEAVALSARNRGTESQNYLVDLHNYAGALIDMGDLEGAAKVEQQVLAMRRRIWGPDHPDTAYSLNNLGWIRLEQGRWQEAEPLLKENLRVVGKISGEASIQYSGAMANWGRVLQMKGDYGAASAMYERAIYSLSVAGKGEGSVAVKITGYQSLLALDRGQNEEALRLAKRALKLQQAISGDTGPQIATCLLNLGTVQLITGSPADAENSFRQSLAIRQNILPATHPSVLLAQARLTEALLAGNKAPEAAQLATAMTSSAKRAPFPLPEWEANEIAALGWLASSGDRSNKEQAAEIRNRIEAYPAASMRVFLLKQLQGSQG